MTQLTIKFIISNSEKWNIQWLNNSANSLAEGWRNKNKFECLQYFDEHYASTFCHITANAIVWKLTGNILNDVDYDIEGWD